MADAEFKIDLSQKFSHLDKAPIIEAVIEIRTRAQSSWEEPEVTQRLKAALPDYPNVQSMNAIRQEFVLGTEQPEHALHELGWTGLRFQSENNLHVAQFNRDNFVFSRLHPYETWEQLEKEALRLWRFHFNVAKPSEIQRLGVRFINRIQMPPEETHFEEFIDPHPMTPRGLDLPFINFLHHETLAVPGHNYGINLTCTPQFPQSLDTVGLGLILDIDVFTIQPFPLDNADLEHRLTEMRWLKNKAFFGTITSKALEAFK